MFLGIFFVHVKLDSKRVPIIILILNRRYYFFISNNSKRCEVCESSLGCSDIPFVHKFCAQIVKNNNNNHGCCTN